MDEKEYLNRLAHVTQELRITRALLPMSMMGTKIQGDLDESILSLAFAIIDGYQAVYVDRAESEEKGD